MPASSTSKRPSSVQGGMLRVAVAEPFEPGARHAPQQARRPDLGRQVQQQRRRQELGVRVDDVDPVLHVVLDEPEIALAGRVEHLFQWPPSVLPRSPPWGRALEPPLGGR
jgi:hypothetical protein